MTGPKALFPFSHMSLTTSVCRKRHDQKTVTCLGRGFPQAAACPGLSGSGRYIRMYGTARATAWGYSLWSFEAYE
jgi:hypothetical protein